MKTSPDNFPAISVGITYGQYVDNFEPDITAIAERMQNAGLTDEQIAETTILFSDKPYPKKKQSTTYGKYNHRKKQVVVYGFEDVKELGIDNYFMAEYLQGAMSDTLMHELEHRIASFDPEQKKQNRKYHNKIFLNWRSMAFSIGGIALGYGINQANANFVHHNSSIIEATAIAGLTYFAVRKAEDKIFSSQIYDEYYQSPEEKRARAAAKHSKGVLSISVKDTQPSSSLVTE